VLKSTIDLICDPDATLNFKNLGVYGACMYRMGWCIGETDNLEIKATIRKIFAEFFKKFSALTTGKWQLSLECVLFILSNKVLIPTEGEKLEFLAYFTGRRQEKGQLSFKNSIQRISALEY
jgi:hypothetical protein